jgi:hypothetical protein
MVVFHHSGHVHDKFQIKLRDFLKQKIDNKKLTKTDARDVFEKTERWSLFFPWLAAWRGIFFPSHAIGSELTVLTKTGEVPRDLALSKVCPGAKMSKFY